MCRSSRRKLRRVLSWLGGASLWVAVMSPPASSSTVTCTYDSLNDTVTVDITPTTSEYGAVFRDGTDIKASAPVQDCGGATVFNTDTVVLNDVSPGGAGDLGYFLVDLGGGPFAPGNDPEAGTSDEIEFIVNYGPGNDVLIFFPGSGAHNFSLGSVGGQSFINANADETDGIDADMTLNGVEYVTMFFNAVYGGVAADTVRGDGSAAAGGAPFTGHLSISAGPGADVLVGGVGGDTFFPMEDGDTVDLGAGNDVVYDTLDDGNDVISGGDGNDGISGGPANDLILGGPGDDSFSGGLGDDTLDGQGGRDTESGDEGLDLVIGGPGADTSLRGGPDNDTIRGKGGKDSLRGQSGNDHLNGGPQYDICKGGPGVDTFANCEVTHQ